MTQITSIPSIDDHPVQLYVGNTPTEGRVVDLSGLRLTLACSADVPGVPRVRVELIGTEAPLSTLQFQGMITERRPGVLMITLERLTVAADQELVDALLFAWFPGVPRVAGCYQQMMRGHGYELRKAILSERVPAPEGPSEVPLSPSETMPGFPGAAVKAALAASAGRAPVVQAPVELPPLPQPARPTAPPPSPPQAAQVIRPPSPPPRPFRGSLPPHVARTAVRLLGGTLASRLWVDCAVEGPSAGAGYGRGVVYRLSGNHRLAFVAAYGIQPGFGGKVELIIDLQQQGAAYTARVASTVAWVAPDPDAALVALIAVRLAPTNQPQHLHNWDIACHYALQQVPKGGPISPLPARTLLDNLLRPRPGG